MQLAQCRRISRSTRECLLSVKIHSTSQAQLVAQGGVATVNNVLEDQSSIKKHCLIFEVTGSRSQCRKRFTSIALGRRDRWLAMACEDSAFVTWVVRNEEDLGLRPLPQIDAEIRCLVPFNDSEGLFIWGTSCS